MGSCGTKCPKEHYNRPISVHNTHKVLEESDGGEDDQQNIAAHSNRNSYKNKPHNQHNQYDSYQPNIQTQPAVQKSVYIPTYQNLISMGYERKLSLEAATKYPTHMNNAIDYVESRQ